MTDQPTANDMANAIRSLSMDAVEKANSGHPGLPMGAADIAVSLFTKVMKFDPADDLHLLTLELLWRGITRQRRASWNPAGECLVRIYVTEVDESVSFLACSHSRNHTLDSDILTDILPGFRVRDNGWRLSAHWEGEQ